MPFGLINVSAIYQRVAKVSGSLRQDQGVPGVASNFSPPYKNRCMRLYIFASDSMIGSMLA